MLIDAREVNPDAANAAVEFLCKSVEASILWERHPTDPILAEVEDLSTEWMVRRLGLIEQEASRAFFGDWPMMTKALPADDPCQDLERRIRGAEPGSLPFTIYLQVIDCWLKRHLPEKAAIGLAQRQAVKQYVAGMLRHRIVAPTPEEAQIAVASLPGSLQQAQVNDWQLTAEDTARLDLAQAQAARHVTDITAATRSRLQRVILDAERERLVQHRQGLQHPRLQQTLQDTFQDLDRDWRRLAVSETSINASDGRVAATPIGEKLQWLAHPGACRYCRSQHLKIFLVVSASKVDKDPETEIWPGKLAMNMGRAIAKRKRTEHGLVDRTDDELVTPVIPAHPECRCNWVRAVPGLQAA